MTDPEFHIASTFPGLENVTEIDLGRNERTFSPEDRYRYLLLSDNSGNRYFSKKLPGVYPDKDKKWSSYLGREPIWAQFAKEVGNHYPDLQLDSLLPEHVEKNSDGQVTQVVYPYIDAPFVADPSDSTNLHNPETMQRYVDVLLAFDQYGMGWTAQDILDNSDEHTPYNQLDKRWDNWVNVGRLVDDGIVTAEMLHRARALLQDHEQYVKPQMQHGDFTPWHLFNKTDEQGNSTWISFDGEHASTIKPRYYDLAYSYSRIFTRAKDQQTASAMLAQFVEKGAARGQFEIDEFTHGFIPVLTSRSIGMFLDAQHDKDKVDYFHEAHDLFERCMTRDLRSLLRG